MYEVSIEDAKSAFPEYTFVKRLTPSVQKAAFHIRDSDGNDLCLKIIAPDYSIDRLTREIEALQKIAHRNVVSLIEYTYSSTAHSHRHYVIEEYIDGDDLTPRLKIGPWTLSDARDFFSMLADGLEQLRQVHVVHRDLKPSNIRVRPDGTPIIIDFGLARHLELTDITGTADGAAIGTPTYFAPEQFLGTKYDIDHRTDLFALGILLYQAVVGHHPFYQSGMNRAALATSICESESHFEDVTYCELPTVWRLLLKRLLAKTRLSRPTSAAQAKVLLAKAEV